MYQELSVLTVVVLAIFTVQLTSADESSIFKDVDNEALEGANNEMPYDRQYWYYPHTSQNFLQTLLRYLALNEQSYRNTVKRQRTFGFMGSRGKRGDAELLSDYLRKLQDKADRKYGSQEENSLFDNQKAYLKIKRQPHRGFHGMRG